MKRLRLNLGCGREIDPNAVNVDRNPFPGVDLVCDIRQLPVGSRTVDEIVASSVLEHLLTPYPVLDEIHRVLRPSGVLWVRVPCLGTYAAHADPTHRFLADLKTWRGILGGYFHKVRVSSEGTKYRDNKLLAGLNLLLIKGLRFHELAQTWIFRCSAKREEARKNPTVWWLTPSGAVVDGLVGMPR